MASPHPTWAPFATGLLLSACQGVIGGATDALPEDGPLTQNAHAPYLASALDDRVVDFGAALRTATLKLTDRLPPLDAIRALESAADPRTAYFAAVDALLDRVEFRRRMVQWARDTLRQGGGDLDSAPTFFARVIAEGLPFERLFTANTDTCPTFDPASGNFLGGDCANGVPVHAGLLTNPGSMRQFHGPMAFRRVRWVQETFACAPFPAEVLEPPLDASAVALRTPWPLETIADSPIHFRDTSSIVCANCHGTMNHLAPLFANFDEEGRWHPTVQVTTPTTPAPQASSFNHWLAEGEETAWRIDRPAATLLELGWALAEDPTVVHCIVARLWNFTMSHDDIVNGSATVPLAVIDPFLAVLSESGGNLRAVLAAMFKSEDFLRF